MPDPAPDGAADEAGRRRWYDDACGTALALELVGERWSLLIVRELMFGGRRFGALKASLPGISANVLTQRLAGLERSGVVARRRLPQPAAAQLYELTPWGRESEAAIQALGRWAVRSPRHDPTLPLSAASLMLSMRTMYAGGIAARIGFVVGEESFAATLTDADIAIVRCDPPADADLVIGGAATAIAAILYGGQPVAAMEAAGALTVAGNRALLERFLTRFPLPSKIGS